MRLFDDQGHLLGQLEVAAVFVVDKALACSGRFSGITARLGAARPFPALRVRGPDGGEDENTRRQRAQVEELLRRRLPRNLVEPVALDRIIDLGGGHCRETLRIAREATLKAILGGSSVVRVTDVDYAEIQRANEFNLTREEWSLLREVLDNPYWSPPSVDSAVDAGGRPSVFLRLLNNLALLEYANGTDKWLRPHPVLIERLKRLRR